MNRSKLVVVLLVLALSFCSCNNSLCVQDLPQLYQQTVSSVVTIKGCGSGILISDKYVLTNNHVAILQLEHTVILSNGLEILAAVHAQDDFNDLALLKIDSNKIKPFKLELETNPQIGEIIFMIGSPRLKSGTITMGILSRQADLYFNIPWVCKVYLSDVIGDHGSSGSPVFNLQRKLIGIVSGHCGPFAVIIPSQAIHNFLRDNKVI